MSLNPTSNKLIFKSKPIIKFQKKPMSQIPPVSIIFLNIEKKKMDEKILQVQISYLFY